VSVEALRSLLTSGARRVREYVWEDTVGVYQPVFVWTMCVAQTVVFVYSLYANDCPAYAEERNAAAAAAAVALNITQVPLPLPLSSEVDGGEDTDGAWRCLGAGTLGPMAFEVTLTLTPTLPQP
jgi:hypothetical protein